ncbi:hypothetical protein LXA47_17685 [Massilia sp. P8910]|uniref:hypothetical protein n=1 Tax=Massilia antarctica TaxID=2765360 RepID=UPI001E2E390A|nr:hypothetical protein [Massilia antarctica]MCE3605420.1 hypothetical protein [Massilia antarctica]
MYSKDAPEALSIALHAVLYEAEMLGLDVDRICAKATEGMFNGAKPYRSGSANLVGPASDVIKDALVAIKG